MLYLAFWLHARPIKYATAHWTSPCLGGVTITALFYGCWRAVSFLLCCTYHARFATSYRCWLRTWPGLWWCEWMKYFFMVTDERMASWTTTRMCVQQRIHHDGYKDKSSAITKYVTSSRHNNNGRPVKTLERWGWCDAYRADDQLGKDP